MKSKCAQLALLAIATSLLSACAGLRPAIFIPKHKPLPPPITQSPRVAVVLGGGGAKGFAHIGVLEVLQKAGVPVDMMAGSSAGAIVGALYADNGNADEAKRALLHAHLWDLADVGNMPNIKGPIEGYHVESFLLKYMRAKNFNQTKIPFMVATTDLKTGELYPIQSGPIAPAVLASAAVPGGVRPVKLYGRILVDGCMTDPVPVNLVQRYHPQLIIAINIDKQLAPTMPWSFYGIYKRAFQISWLTLTYYTARQANIIIRPQTGSVGTFEWSAKQRMYQAGITAGQQALPQILALLKEKGIPLNKSNQLQRFPLN